MLPQLSPHQIAWQNFRHSGVASWKRAGVLQSWDRNLMLCIDLREKMPSQYRVRLVKGYKSKKGNHPSIPQTFSGWVRWTCGGDWEPFGHRSRDSTPVTVTAAQHHDSSLCARMQLLWGGSGSDRLDLAQDTHIWGGMSTCLLLEAILMDVWYSVGALVLLTGVVTPPFCF